ncbi:DUF4178 domain-containing protein [Paenibacillus sp. PCH8]|uniref:DUF4178 domain-containing protein n=1 Tax=Paenibacillus sp. PCH8 TaxID=2066524 RepID=UPI000CFA02DC|nr:DUF4178 domain-containing protein [Paenibacillus sp. PCH8]PQP81769.1 DUF4178 domain-containing protein [Paenibacillus sp. PCH8]
MSVWKRIKGILTKPEPPQVEKTMLQLAPGDICEVSLVTYEVVGRVQNRARNAVVLTLQDGTAFRYLHIEEREITRYALYTPIDGRLDAPDEVPTLLDLDGRAYHLEEEYDGVVSTVGRTPYGQAGEQLVWQYQSDDNMLLRVEWQDRRFTLYEGESILTADIKVIRSS